MKNYKRRTDEETQQLYGLVRKATEKGMKKIINFEELECGKTLNINQ